MHLITILLILNHPETNISSAEQQTSQHSLNTANDLNNFNSNVIFLNDFL